MRILTRFLLITAVLWSAPAYAQLLNSTSKSDTISSSGDYVELSASLLGGFGSVKVQTLDSYTGTWEVQCAADGVNYDTAAELKMTAVDSTTTVTSVTDSVGIWDVANAAGCVAIRVIATADFSATDTVVVISATQTGGGGASGGGAGGGDASAANQTTMISHLADLTATVDGGGSTQDINISTVGGVAPNAASSVNLDSDGGTQTRDGIALVVPAAAGGNVVKGTEDEAHTSGDGLVGVAARRIDTLATSAGTSGDYVTFNQTAEGAQWVATSATTNGGCTPHSIISANTVNETAIKASAGQLYWLNVTNIGANEVFFKLYNDTTANIDETDTPVLRLVIPGNAAGNGNSGSIPVGVAFSAAITYRITGAAADADTTAIAASEVLVSACFK